MFIFKEKMKSLCKYFVGWQEVYDFEDRSYEIFKYTKNDYVITFCYGCMGWEVALGVDKNNVELVDIEYGKCHRLAKEFNKNNIRRRVKKVYNNSNKFDKTTGLYTINDLNESMIDLYIEYLLEMEILSKPNEDE